ncbi:MAG: hypothetical protein PUG48_04975 [Clostridia bacterium]|nr:hypothetical protein [Clostridia bacterium]
MNKFIKMLSVTAVSASVIVACLTGCSGGGNNGFTVSGKESCDVSVEGINGKGTISLLLNEDDLDKAEKAIYGEPPTDFTQYTQYAEATSKFESAVASMSYIITSEKKDNFSNGDVVTIKLSYNEQKLQEAGIAVSDDTFEYTVSGLTEATNVDPFEGLKVEYTGISPNVQVTLDTSGCHEYVRNNVSFSISGDNGSFANGEKFNITADYNESKAETNAINITNTINEYTVEGALEYPSTLDGVDLSAIETQFNDMLESAMSKENVFVGKQGNLSALNDWSAKFQITKVEPKIVLKAYLTSKHNQSYVDYENEYDCFWEINVTAKCTDKGYSSKYKTGQVVNYKLYYVAGIQNIPVDTNKVIPQEYLNDYDDKLYDNADTTYQEVYNNWITSNKANYNIEEMPAGNTQTSTETSTETSKETSTESSAETSKETSTQSSAPEESSKQSSR